MRKLDYYFDFLSPYSYLAWRNIVEQKEWLKSHEVELQLRPVVLAKLLNHFEIKGPGEIKPKREYMFRALLRYAQKNNIPFMPPMTHPFNPLYALRLATQACSGSSQHDLVDCLWCAGWGGGSERIDLACPDQLQLVLNSMGFEGAHLIEKSFERAAKLELKQNCRRAIELGLFGVPSFVIDDNEIFWGNDSIDDLMKYIEGNDQLDRKLYQECLGNTQRGAGDQSLF